jgi:SAM-dependent methyltransferase
MSGTPIPALAEKATREDVIAAYRFILGREPESEAVIAKRLRAGVLVGDLRRMMLRSEEFRSRHPATPAALLPLAPPPLSVQVEADPAQRAAMLARTAAVWTRLGQEAPHWSVLTQDQFRPAYIAETRAAFYASGERDRALVSGTLARHGLSPADLPRLVEFGCGVGRASLALAQDFREVIACDISPSHMALGRRAASEAGRGNIGWFHSTAERPMPGGRHDLWFSRLVLQHNPPPAMAWLLATAFGRLAPGGVAMFQVPTHQEGYRFEVEAYLAREPGTEMEMHVLPQATVFRLAAEARLQVLEVREDTQLIASSAATWLSNFFVLRRPAARGSGEAEGGA